MRKQHYDKYGLLKTSLGLGVIAGLSLVLTGCGIFPNNSSQAGATNSPVPEASKIASSLPTPSTPAPVLDDTNPIYKACSELISIEALYDFNPNYSYDASATPTTGSLGEKALQKSGVFCRYLNLSNGSQIDVSVAQIPVASSADWNKKVEETSRPTDAYGNSPEVLGFFARSNNEGVAQAIQGTKWVAITSSTFFEAGDAAALMSQVLHSLAN